MLDPGVGGGDAELMKLIDRESIGDRLTWQGIVEALRAGHLMPRAKISDQFLTRSQDAFVSRAAWIDGLGFGVKSFSVIAENTSRGLPSVQGAMLVFEDEGGRIEAIIESDLVTEWKTAGDSVLGAQLLARPDAKSLLIVGAGVVAASLVRAYSAMFPGIERIAIWNRTAEKATQLASLLREHEYPVEAAADLAAACRTADIVSSATMARDPVLRGEWIVQGTHVDLIGAFKSDMREADDLLLQRGRLFVDSRETTIGHIGELAIPIAAGAITERDVLGDLYDLVTGDVGRKTEEEITIYKNGGGAHLDLMTAKHILAVAE